MVWGSLGGVKRDVLDLYRTLFAPLEVLYGTRFGSKQHIMVQLADADHHQADHDHAHHDADHADDHLCAAGRRGRLGRWN